MKQIFKFITLSASLLYPLIFTGEAQLKKQKTFDTVADRMASFSPPSIKIKGYLGEKMDLVIDKRIKAQDVDHLIEPFRHKEETRLWQSEFWGKWIQSAIAAYNYKHDPELLQIINNAVNGLLATQMPNGYIGNYTDIAALQQWDIWGRKYTLLGLLSYYDLTGDKNSLKASCRLADHLLTQVGPGKANIVMTGNYRRMPSSSILEPMVFLYRRTGDKRYLDFSKYIVEQRETPNGPKLISSALSGIPVSERFPHPPSWWSYENGTVELVPVSRKPANVWMAFTAPLALGTDLEGEFREPKQISFCDFASAGNTWGEDSRYRVWIPQTLNVMGIEYKTY